MSRAMGSHRSIRATPLPPPGRDTSQSKRGRPLGARRVRAGRRRASRYLHHSRQIHSPQKGPVMTHLPQEAVEAACNAFQRPNRMLVNTSDGNLMGRLEAAFEAALPHIEKEIRAQVAADIWEYWDACGDLIDDRDSARQAIDAIAAQIAKGTDND